MRSSGVNSTGLPFNSVIAIERTGDRTTNPMVNAGAIAATSLAPGPTAESKWQFIRDGLSAFAGRELSLNTEVYQSEAAANRRNQGIANLLGTYGRIYFNDTATTEIYTNSARLMSRPGSRRDGGDTGQRRSESVTGNRIIDAIHCQHVLAVMVTAGLYENSGDWLDETGLPGKSGVSGGMVAVSPARAGSAFCSTLRRCRK